MNTAIRVICFTLLLSAFGFHAAAEDFTNAIHAYLQQCVDNEVPNGCMVVGLVDERGSRIVSYGKLDNGTSQEANGDTLFEIGSVTKTFTGLLLQDMIARGEMNLDDPVAKYLPKSVRMPNHNGKEITLRHLATQTSGLPHDPDNYEPKQANNLFADYTIEELYTFLSNYKLTRDPGAQFEYSNLGFELLGYVIAVKARMNYEALVTDRICRPLKMDSTGITLTPELKSRLATGHNTYGFTTPVLTFSAVTAGAGALHSTANDLLKYLSANLGLTPSSLTPFMGEMQIPHFHGTTNFDLGLVWWIRDLHGTKIIWHGGATPGFSAYVGIDKARRRGVVVLCDRPGVSLNAMNFACLGDILFESGWDSDRRPAETNISTALYDSYVGEYQRKSGFKLWPFFRQEDDVTSQSGIGIRHEGNRLLAQATRWPPVDELLPPVAGELLPESETRFFERLSGKAVIFSRDFWGKVTGLTMEGGGGAFSFEKTSDQAPKAPEPPKPRVAAKLDPTLLDAIVGQYEFPAKEPFPTGAKLSISREGALLVGTIRGENTLHGAFDLFPESETNFFVKVNGAQLTFIKNDKGEVTAVIHHSSHAGVPDIEGKKLKNE